MTQVGHNAALQYVVDLRDGHPPIWEMQEWVHSTWEEKPSPKPRLSFCFVLGKPNSFHCSDQSIASAVRIMWG